MNGYPANPRSIGGAARRSNVQNRILRELGFGATRLVEAASIEATGQIADAVQEAGKVRSRQLLALAEVFRTANLDSGARTTMFAELGVLGQQAIVEQYIDMVEGEEGAASASHYRAGKGRLAGGVLRRALASPGFFEAGSDGLRFINMTMLDNEAAHWHRLAFGAGAVGHGSHVRFTVSYGNLVLAAMGIDEGPSRSFMIPAGFWVPVGGEGRGSGAFYPMSARVPGGRRKATFQPRQMTEGIVGRPFLDVGVETIARGLPLALDRYYRNAYRRFRQGAGPFTAIATIPPRPNPAFRGRFNVA